MHVHLTDTISFAIAESQQVKYVEGATSPNFYCFAACALFFANSDRGCKVIKRPLRIKIKSSLYKPKENPSISKGVIDRTRHHV